jgi:hypothetical protein
VVQRLLAESIWIDQAVLCERYDSLGNCFVSDVSSVFKFKGCTRHFVCDAHDAPGLRIESVTVEEFGDRHNALLAVQAGAQISLSATGA